MSRDSRRAVRVDWARIAAAEEFYVAAGFAPVAVPWVVGDDAYRSTLPPGAAPYATLGGYLVASGEQSFLQLLEDGVPLAAAQCTTPCFRDEDHDTWHSPYFMKVELIRVDDASTAALEEMLAAAETFLSRYTPVSRLRLPDGTVDLLTTDGGVELGSYGLREHRGRPYVYGTGLAEPRLAQALAAMQTGRGRPDPSCGRRVQRRGSVSGAAAPQRRA